jgi:hypothetical protein
MSMQNDLLQKALELSRAGKKEDARKLFQAVLRLDRTNQAAWWGYVDTFSDREERIEALELFARLAPGNPRVQQIVKKLRETKPAVPHKASGTPAASTAAPPRGRKPYPASTPPAAAVLQGTQSTKASATSKSQAGANPAYLALVSVIAICLVVSTLLLAISNARLRQRYNSLYAHYEQQQQAYQRLYTVNSRLKKNYDLLVGQYNNLQANYTNLNQSFERLTGQYNTLQSEYNDLRAGYDKLQANYNDLSAGYSTLQSEYKSLLAGYNAQVDSYNTLNQQAVKPPYIYIHQRNIYLAFFREDGQLLQWQIPFESLESAIEQGYDTRAKLDWYTLITDNGDDFQVRDYRVFVQPYAFNDVITSMYNEAPSADAFIRQVWQIVTQLTPWTNEIGDVPRFPLETLLAGGGDCEDLSILFASMIKAAPVDWQVDLVYIDTEDLVHPESINHLIVHVNTGERDYLIETTSNQDMEPYRDGLSGWYLAVK